MTDRLPATARDRAVLFLLLVWSTAVPAAVAVLLWATSDTWVELVRDSESAGWWMFAATATLTALSLVPSHVAALACGFVLGAGRGVTVAWVGLAAAAMLGYGIARPLVTARAERLLCAHPRAEAVRQALIGGARPARIGIVALLRLSPVVPFAFCNFAMAAARVPFLDFQVGSWLGMTLRVVVVALAGAGVSELAEAETGSPWTLAVGIAATAAVLWWIGRRAARALRARGVV